MPGIFVGNFDFEHTLAGVRRPKASSLGRDLLAAFTAVALPGDAIWDAGVWDAEFGAELEGLGRTDSFCTRERDEYQVVPWGWTPDVCDLSRREGWHVEAPPPLDTVRRVNSRSFSLSLEQAADTVPRGACVVRSVAEFESAVAALDPGAKWLARAEFSMSGRERICGAGAPNAAHRGWVWNRLSEHQEVVVEPWLRLVAEAGFQLHIACCGSVILDGVTGLLSRSNGQFLGCLLDRQLSADWKSAEPSVLAAAARVAELGYRGPLGVDAARYQTEEGECLRPLQDINGRLTMGRLALGWCDVLGDEDLAAWLFIPWGPAPREFIARVRGVVPDSVRVARTSPLEVDGIPVGLGSVLLSTPDRDAMAFAIDAASDVAAD